MSSEEKQLTLNLKVWRPTDGKDKGQMVDYTLEGVSTDSSFLEMMDQLNEKLVVENQDPVAFDHDCREGICGMCSLMINGQAHGPESETTTCQLHMRKFNDGDTVVIEPWRARAFPVVKDLMVDRSAFDEIIMAGGYVNVNTGNAQDANEILVPKEDADLAMDAAACIGCAACDALCLR
jgi:succinate dehydrogenase / fumarate reductase iron-sulfur subunit